MSDDDKSTQKIVALAAEVVSARLLAAQETLHAPHLHDVEVAHVVRRFAAIGSIDAERGREALADLADFPLRRYPHALLLQRVWELRRNFTAYDAVYAEALDVPLLTRDQRLAGRARAHIRVELV
ncbi:MAG TPA: type II toxin-antitoxin system VapC family toxin [Stellaceae bacterium]|nr:type II toxin-antitoxin system VapC family toxin [Stellaceae bacterium]